MERKRDRKTEKQKDLERHRDKYRKETEKAKETEIGKGIEGSQRYAASDGIPRKDKSRSWFSSSLLFSFSFVS